MSYTHKIIRENELTTAAWSGGTSTQLAIYPKDALYGNRDFLWRLSTAKVETEESVFTALPGIKRVIMVLDGSMLLKHEGHHEVFLESFQQDSFMGDWITRSYGCVSDFNLMMNDNCKGDVKALIVEPDANLTVKSGLLADNRYNTLSEVFYFLSTIKVVLANNESFTMQRGDMLFVQKFESEEDIISLQFFNPQPISKHIIQASIWHNK